MPDLDLRVGLIRQVADGAYIKSRATRDGAQTVQQLHGQFYEATLRAFKYVASTGVGGTLFSSLAASGTGCFFALYNPRNSYTNVVLDKLFISYTNGGANVSSVVGCLYHVIVPVVGAAPTGGTAITPQNSLIGGPAGIATAFTGSGSGNVVVLNTAGTPYRPVGFTTVMTSASTQNPAIIIDEVNGEIILLPGMTWGLQLFASAATSSTAIYGVAISYEEVPSVSIAGG